MKIPLLLQVLWLSERYRMPESWYIRMKHVNVPQSTYKLDESQWCNWFWELKCLPKWTFTVWKNRALCHINASRKDFSLISRPSSSSVGNGCTMQMEKAWEIFHREPPKVQITAPQAFQWVWCVHTLHSCKIGETTTLIWLSLEIWLYAIHSANRVFSEVYHSFVQCMWILLEWSWRVISGINQWAKWTEHWDNTHEYRICMSSWHSIKRDGKLGCEIKAVVYKNQYCKLISWIRFCLLLKQ
jgi:hypothetical protein